MAFFNKTCHWWSTRLSIGFKGLPCLGAYSAKIFWNVLIRDFYVIKSLSWKINCICVCCQFVSSVCDGGLYSLRDPRSANKRLVSAVAPAQPFGIQCSPSPGSVQPASWIHNCPSPKKKASKIRSMRNITKFDPGLEAQWLLFLELLDFCLKLLVATRVCKTQGSPGMEDESQWKCSNLPVPTTSRPWILPQLPSTSASTPFALARFSRLYVLQTIYVLGWTGGGFHGCHVSATQLTRSSTAASKPSPFRFLPSDAILDADGRSL